MSEIEKAFVDLIPVIGGAVIGVIGGLVGTAYASKLSHSKDKNSEMRAKLEAMVVESYELYVWLKKQEDYYLYGGLEVLEQSPMAKIEALGALFFRELDAEVLSLSDADMNYRKWLLDGAQERMAARAKTPSNTHLELLPTVYGPLQAAQARLVTSARNLMITLYAP